MKCALRLVVVLVALAAAAPLSAIASAGRAGAAPRPNILLIVLDDVGTDHLASYGETRGGKYAVTPRIDKLAMQGILFRNFYVNPVCSTTRACMQTGRYAFRHGVGGLTNRPPGSTDELASSEVTLAELLRYGFAPGTGYASGFFGKWHLSHQGKPGHAVQNGYARFRGLTGNTGDHLHWVKVEHDAGEGFVELDVHEWSASVTRADALEWINAQTSPWFATVAFNPPHKPFEVPPYELLSEATRVQLENLDPKPPSAFPPRRGDPGHRVSEKSSLAMLYYRAMLESVDTEIGRLLDGIDPSKAGSTLALLTSDNGTPGPVIAPPHDPDHGKGTTFQHGVRVPMIAVGPLIPPVPMGHPLGKWESSALVGAVDLFRTFAELTGADEALAFQTLGLEPPCSDSISFAPVLLDPTLPGARPFAFAQGFTPNVMEPPCLTWCLPDPCLNDCLTAHTRGITDGTWKYIRTQLLKPDPCAPPIWRELLFDITEDADEQFDRLVYDEFGAHGDTLEADLAYQVLRDAMLELSGD